MVYGTELIKQTWSAGGQHGWKLAAVFDTGREFSDEERAQDYWSDDWRFKDSMLVFEAPPPPGFTPTGLVNMGHVVGGYAVAQPVQPMQKHVSSQPAHVPPPPPCARRSLLCNLCGLSGRLQCHRLVRPRLLQELPRAASGRHEPKVRLEYDPKRRVVSKASCYLRTDDVVKPYGVYRPPC